MSDPSAHQFLHEPPFNISEWWDAKLEDNPHWHYGTPPRGNANFAWIQHILHHLALQGSMAVDLDHLRSTSVLLANGYMNSGSGGESEIRRALIEADLVECIVALPASSSPKPKFPPASVWMKGKM